MFKQYKLPGAKIAHRFPKGTLNTLLMGYVIDRDNNAEISLANGAKLSASYGNPQYPIRVDSLRRNVGLTQQLTDKERDSDPNALIITGVASLYLDGSVVSGLKFGNGRLKTFPKLNPNDPIQIDEAWSVRGGSGVLKPPSKIDDKWVVDFTEYDLSSAHPRPTDSIGTTDANYEDVIITMGAKKKTHKVEPKPKKRN